MRALLAHVAVQICLLSRPRWGTNVQANSAKFLDASNNKITSLEGLDQTSSNLEKVNLSGNQLAHFANVNFSLPSVKTLDISGNQVASINSLAKLQALFPRYDFSSSLTMISCKMRIVSQQ